MAEGQSCCGGKCEEPARFLIYQPAIDDLTPYGAIIDSRFTCGERYPLLEHNIAEMTFKTLDNSQKEVWVKEGRFSIENNSDAKLTYESDNLLGKCKKEMFEGLEMDEENKSIFDKCFEVPDIGKAATEKGVGTKIELDEDCLALSKTVSEMLFEDSRFKMEPHIYRAGKVCDRGNVLIKNLDRCDAAVSKVFYDSKAMDPDLILNCIKGSLPDIKLSWGTTYLQIGDSDTKISYGDVKEAYSGLRKIMSPNASAKTVSKIVANKLKKVF